MTAVARGPLGMRSSRACSTSPALSSDHLAGTVERITFHNEENGFSVLRVQARGRREPITVVGHAASVSVGEFIQAEGAWVNDRVHGLQFSARRLASVAPTTVEGIEKYLGSGLIKGIGPHFARRLVDAFGTSVFDVIDQEPGRLRSVEGIGRTRASPHRRGLEGAEGGPRHHGLPALARRRHVARGADLQDLRPRRDRHHLGEPVPPRRRHPGNRLPHRGQDRVHARHREDGDDPRAGGHRLHAVRGDGRWALRPADVGADAGGRAAARYPRGAGGGGARPRDSRPRRSSGTR